VSPAEGRVRVRDGKAEIKALAIKASFYKSTFDAVPHKKIVNFLTNLKRQRWQI
jgi:hypothetical protein